MEWKKTALYSFFAVNALIILAIWWPYSGRLLMRGDMASILVSLANLAALSAVFLILNQLILIGRVKWVETVFGLDRLWIAHHLIGISIPVLIIAHPLMLSIGRGMKSGRSAWDQFLLYVTVWEDVVLALVAALLFVFLVAWAFIMLRKKLNYEWWYLGHVTMYAAIILAIFHQLNSTDDLNDGWAMAYWYALYIFAFGNLIFFRFVMPLYRTWRHGFTVDRVVRETPDAVSVYISGNNLERYHVKAGQFMIFRFLDAKRWRQAHPFSLSALPDGKSLRITVKALGDYSSDIGSLKPGTRVLIDGPHGTFTLRKSNKTKLLLIGGGAGITPIRPLFEDAIGHGLDVTAIYAARNVESAVLLDEMKGLSETRNSPVHVLFSRSAAEKGERRYVDLDYIHSTVPDVVERDVFVCGPPAMMRTVKEALRKLGVPEAQVHYEKFSL